MTEVEAQEEKEAIAARFRALVVGKVDLPKEVVKN